MKPDPSEVTCRDWLPRGPRKFLNSSESGESSGRSGIWPRAGAFSVCEVEMFTTVGSSLAVSWANDAGALGRGVTCACAGATAGAASRQNDRMTAGSVRMGGKDRDSGGTLKMLLPDKQGEFTAGTPVPVFVLVSEPPAAIRSRHFMQVLGKAEHGSFP